MERTAALPPLNLPADDAPHGSAMEWWYYSGILDAEAGQRYAFHMVVFVANGLIKHTVMHVALTDLQTGKRYASQTRTGGIPATSVANGFDFRQERWQVAASPSSHVLRATFDGASIAFDLGDSGPTVAHRAPGSDTPGLLDFGKSGISYYYSRPRLSAQGNIAIGGKSIQVSGDVWFDHQWGEFDVLALGWNWFALHLADGSDLMLYELFDMDGRKVMTAGTISNAKGSVPLKPGEVELVPGNTWTSPKTDITYVVEWSIKLSIGRSEHQALPGRQRIRFGRDDRECLLGRAREGDRQPRGAGLPRIERVRPLERQAVEKQVILRRRRHPWIHHQAPAGVGCPPRAAGDTTCCWRSRGMFVLGPLAGVTAAYMNFSLGFFVGGQVLAGLLGSAVTAGYGAAGRHGANYIQTAAASVASMSGMGVLLQAMVWMGLPQPPAWQMVLYLTCVGMFGVGVGMLYTPVLVDRMRLVFPSGLAVANILRALTDTALLRRSVRQLGGGMAAGLVGGTGRGPAAAARRHRAVDFDLRRRARDRRAHRHPGGGGRR